MVRLAQDGTGAEQLIQRQPPVKDIAAHQTESPLEVQRRQRHPSQNARLEARCPAIDRVDHQIGDGLAMVVP